MEGDARAVNRIGVIARRKRVEVKGRDRIKVAGDDSEMQDKRQESRLKVRGES